MNIEIERPRILYGLLLLIPVVIFTFRNYIRLMGSLSKWYEGKQNAEGLYSLKRLKFSLLGRTFCRCIVLICFDFALAGISWGAHSVPVPKTGSAVSFVFDISYSMTARDAPGGISRLDSAKAYAVELLDRLPHSAVSVVLAKGDGVIAVPLTEDMASVYPLISSLSPNLMSAVGTSLGKGINAAIKSFPVQSSQADSIWIFTDGEDNDGSLSNALADAIKYGISVTVIGFGNERECEVLAGDGKTYIKTALRTKKIVDAIETALEKRIFVGHHKLSKVASLEYVDSTEIGSAIRILSSLKDSYEHIASERQQLIAYELETVPQHQLFIAIAIIFFIFSFIIGELDIKAIKQKKFLIFASLVSCMFLLTSCNNNMTGAKEILQSTWNWHQKRYIQATAGFIKTIEKAQATGNKTLEQYAIYGLATTYLMQNESDAAYERFMQISEDAPDAILYASYYNAGIIAHRKGNYEDAADLFKKALLIKSNSTNAKINLELSLQQEQVMSQSGEQLVSPLTESNTSKNIENAIFSVIQENDKKQWMSQQLDNQHNSAEDF